MSTPNRSDLLSSFFLFRPFPLLSPAKPTRYRPCLVQDTSPEMPSDVSWEELRSTYLKNRNKSKARVRKSQSLPSYGDAVSGGGRDARPPPPSYSPVDEQNSRHLSIGIPADHTMDSIRGGGSKGARSARQMMTSTSSARMSVGSSKSKSQGHLGGISPGSRAVSARRAARDAQLSAERALAAAAMASRAADLAAQAALDVSIWYFAVQQSGVEVQQSAVFTLVYPIRPSPSRPDPTRPYSSSCVRKRIGRIDERLENTEGNRSIDRHMPPSHSHRTNPSIQ